jgi:hypothetical protein
MAPGKHASEDFGAPQNHGEHGKGHRLSQTIFLIPEDTVQGAEF